MLFKDIAKSDVTFYFLKKAILQYILTLGIKKLQVLGVQFDREIKGVPDRALQGSVAPSRLAN